VGCQTFRTIPQTGQQRREDLKPELATLIDEFRASVPKLMKEGKIPGCAIALVDKEGILWAEGFGTTDFKREIPVTPDTLFNIGSISKAFTATAVLSAVQDGLLDLDEPIATYLPDFKVYSRYETDPSEKITLRRLLSHTAGIPHETTGCNMLEVTDSFEDRVTSLYGTWLRYPVGQGYSYSGAGYDLAAYIIQIVSGVPFEQVMADRVFRPLGMLNSTLDPNEVRSNTNRAIGHMIGIAEHPTAHGLIGAGGVWTSASDLAQLMRLFLNEGTVDGKRFLDESLIDTMLTPNAVINKPEDEDKLLHSMGIVFSKRRLRKEVIDTLGHAGAGGGYLTHFEWYPEFGAGSIVLTNRMPHSVLGDLTIGRRLHEEGILNRRFPTQSWDRKQLIPKWTTWPKHNPSCYRPEWKKYCRNYRLRFSGYKLKWWAKLVLALGLDQYTPRIKVSEKNGYLCLTESLFFETLLSGNFDRQVDSRLMEAKPGVFYTASGDVLDFSGKDPTWRSYRLKKR